jgi:hypothetical protein
VWCVEARTRSETSWGVGCWGNRGLGRPATKTLASHPDENWRAAGSDTRGHRRDSVSATSRRSGRRAQAARWRRPIPGWLDASGAGAFWRSRPVKRWGLSEAHDRSSRAAHGVLPRRRDRVAACRPLPGQKARAGLAADRPEGVAPVERTCVGSPPGLGSSRAAKSAIRITRMPCATGRTERGGAVAVTSSPVCGVRAVRYGHSA